MVPKPISCSRLPTDPARRARLLPSRDQHALRRLAAIFGVSHRRFLVIQINETRANKLHSLLCRDMPPSEGPRLATKLGLCERAPASAFLSEGPAASLAWHPGLHLFTTDVVKAMAPVLFGNRGQPPIRHARRRVVCASSGVGQDCPADEREVIHSRCVGSSGSSSPYRRRR